LNTVFIPLSAAAYKVFFHHFVRLTTRGGFLFCFFTLSKGIDVAQSFLGYVLSTKLFFRILFSSASRAIRHRRDYDKQKALVVV